MSKKNRSAIAEPKMQSYPQQNVYLKYASHNEDKMQN